MIIQFTEEAWEDFEWFLDNDKQIVKRIRRLLKDISRNPNTGEGIGKPERLRFELSGYSSKRINDEHRSIYKIEKDAVLVLSCRYHYSD